MIRSTDVNVVIETSDDERDFRAKVSAYSLTCHLAQEEGPGGGWPVWRVTGEESDVLIFICDWCDVSEEEAHAFLNAEVCALCEGIITSDEVMVIARASSDVMKSGRFTHDTCAVKSGWVVQ